MTMRQITNFVERDHCLTVPGPLLRRKMLDRNGAGKRPVMPLADLSCLMANVCFGPKGDLAPKTQGLPQHRATVGQPKKSATALE